MTATSREIITDIHTLTRQISDVELPKPLAMFSLLFRKGNASKREGWFEALKCWSEIGDVAESESWGELVIHSLTLHYKAPKFDHLSQTPVARASLNTLFIFCYFLGSIPTCPTLIVPRPRPWTWYLQPCTAATMVSSPPSSQLSPSGAYLSPAHST